MKKEIKRGSTTVLELSRKERHWECSECGKEYSTLPDTCICSAPDKVFLEKDFSVKESTRKEYEVLQNFILELDIIKKGSTVSLIEKDKVTKDLVKRGIVKELVLA